MKLIYIVLAGLWIASCSAPAKQDKTKTIAGPGPVANEDTLTTEPDTASHFPEKVYEFLMTRDPRFCHKDSIVEGDCNSGYFYFTPRGNVIYYYLCLGASNYFSIGKAKETPEGIELTFDKSYSYPSADVLDPTIKEMNSGKLEKTKPFTIRLTRLSCRNKTFGFNSGTKKSPEYYVVEEVDPYTPDEYIRIKALKNF